MYVTCMLRSAQPTPACTFCKELQVHSHDHVQASPPLTGFGIPPCNGPVWLCTGCTCPGAFSFTGNTKRAGAAGFSTLHIPPLNIYILGKDTWMKNLFIVKLCEAYIVRLWEGPFAVILNIYIISL